MEKKLGGVTMVAILLAMIGLWGICNTSFSEPVQVGGAKPGKALWTDYWGMSKEVQGPVDTILFVQSKPTASGDPYHSYPYYVPSESRIASYNVNTKQLNVLTKDFQCAFDPCTYWDGSKFLFAGIHKKGGGCQIWEMNIDGTGLRQLTDVPGVCRTPIYYAAASIEEGKGKIVWRDRYFEGDWKIRGEVEKTGVIILAYAPDGVLDEFHRPGVFNIYRLDPIGGRLMERVTGHKLMGMEFPNLNTVMEQITFNMSANFDLWLTPDGNVMFSSIQANGARNEGKGTIPIFVDNWDGWYPRHIYGNLADQDRDLAKINAKCSPDGRIIYIETPQFNYGVGQLASVKWTAPYKSTYKKLSKDDGGLYRSPYPLPDGRLLVSYAERGDFGIYWFDENAGRPGQLIYNDPAWNEHQPAPVYNKYRQRWINTFGAGQNFGVTAVTYQPFDQVNVEGYPNSWGTWICFDTTITDMPLGPLPEQRTKELKHGDVKAVRIVEGLGCIESDSKKFAVGVGKHLLGGDRSSSNSGTMYQQRRIIGYQYVEDDGSVVTSQQADIPYYIQLLDNRGMAVQTLLGWSYIRPYGERICIGCHDGSYGGKAYKNVHAKALYNWWYSDLSHYDSPFAFANIRVNKDGYYAGVKHGEDIVVPSDVYYGGPSGTTSQPVEGLRPEMRRTVDFRRDIQPIIDAKCASCHDATQGPDLSGSLSLVNVGGTAAYSQAYNSLLEPQKGKDKTLGGKYVNPGSAINSLLIWRLYEESLSPFSPKENPFPRAGRVLHDSILTPEERYTFVEWIDIGAQWDNIQGPDHLPGYIAQ